jgi:hypothetical protein
MPRPDAQRQLFVDAQKKIPGPTDQGSDKKAAGDRGPQHNHATASREEYRTLLKFR